MEKFCDFITDPALWGAIATFGAAVITYLVGKRQNKINTYNENKILYVKIKSIHNFANSILVDVNRTLYHFKYNEEYFNKQSIELIELLRWLQDNKLDLSNKVGMNEKEYNSYYALLNTLHSLLCEIDRGIRKKQIITPDTEYNFSSPTDDNFIKSILYCCVDEETKDRVNNLLLKVKECKKNLRNRLLKTLQELCTL